MPVMDGYKAAKHQATTQNLVPIFIAFMARAFAEDKATVLSVGCDDFVSKPFREEVTFEKMAHYVGVRYSYEQTDLSSAEKPKVEAIFVNFIPESLPEISPQYKAQLYQGAMIALDDELMRQLY